MTGKVRAGASVIGCSSSSMSEQHAWRALPLMTIMQAPQTFSKQLHSQVTGGTVLPSTVTGFF